MNASFNQFLAGISDAARRLFPPLALLACGLALTGCAPGIQFRSGDTAGAGEAAPPTELITDTLIANERRQHR